MIHYRNLKPEELNTTLFAHFKRRQVVTKCWRKENEKWIIRDAPFIDDWSPSDYEILVSCLQNTLATNGFVCGAFLDDQLKGFVSVEGTPLGSRGQYLDLTSIHVSQDARHQGIGHCLFDYAKQFAKERNAKKLYISAHSAVESQAFYRAMGCVEALEYNKAHVQQEPYDCQLEYQL